MSQSAFVLNTPENPLKIIIFLIGMKDTNATQKYSILMLLKDTFGRFFENHYIIGVHHMIFAETLVRNRHILFWTIKLQMRAIRIKKNETGNLCCCTECPNRGLVHQHCRGQCRGEHYITNA